MFFKYKKLVGVIAIIMAVTSLQITTIYADVASDGEVGEVTGSKESDDTSTDLDGGETDIVLSDMSAKVNGHTLVWRPVEGADGYYFTLGDFTIFRKSTSIDMYSFAANNSLTNGSYAYTLYAVNAAGERITNDFTGTFTYAKVGSVNCTVSYKTQIQKTGWESSYVTNGTTSGTVGKSLRLEAIIIKVSNDGGLSGSVNYRTHVQKQGWQSWVKDGAISGTVGKSLRLEAIQINLAGDIGDYFDIYYRVQAEKFGWLGWAKNGEAAGTSNYALRLEAIQIVVKAKNAYCISDKPTSMGGVADASDKYAYYNKNTLPRLIYSTHVQSYGWMSWVSNGAVAGTIGKSKRLEAIRIELIGQIAKDFDVYYRVHAQRFGWMGWARNGENAGTAGFGRRLEGIQIVLWPKDGVGPGATYKNVERNDPRAFVEAGVKQMVLTHFSAALYTTIAARMNAVSEVRSIFPNLITGVDNLEIIL